MEVSVEVYVECDDCGELLEVVSERIDEMPWNMVTTLFVRPCPNCCKKEGSNEISTPPKTP
jgi:hypothetical protein